MKVAKLAKVVLKAETVTGIPCQPWSAQAPHQHQFTAHGDHGFCRLEELSAQNWLSLWGQA